MMGVSYMVSEVSAEQARVRKKQAAAGATQATPAGAPGARAEAADVPKAE